MMALTIAKLLTALVSCATAITLLTLIPLLLKIKVREIFLKQNVLELDQEVGMMKKQKEAGWHVRMLTQEIRKSLDKHTILYTTLVELSKTLELQNCAVWMLDENKTEMNLTHELRSNSSKNDGPSIPINDPDILEITKTKGVRILGPNSKLGSISSGGSSGESGPVAAIRMPMLRVSNFKGGTPELVETCYALLILVLPANERSWSYEEMEIVEVVADQVAVALSHAAVLEESQLMREKLGEQNRVLQQAKENAMMASQARNSFQKVMSQGIRRPMHSILGLLSMFQDDSLTADQRIIIETILKTSNVLSTLINDVMEIPTKDSGKFPLQMSPFSLRCMIKEASCLIKCLCIYKGFGFGMDISSKLPNEVIGDERRTFQVLFHMVGHLLNVSERGGSVVFKVSLENGIEGRNDKNWGMRRAASSDENATVKFEIGISDEVSQSDGGGKKPSGNEFKDGLSFTMCRKLVQMMQGDIWMAANSLGNVQSMNLILRFQIQPAIYRRPFFNNNAVEQQQPKSNSIYRGLQVILADDDGINRMVTKKLLEKLGCQVSAVSSGFECLSCLGLSATSVRVIILDLQMPEMDGFEVATRIRKFRSGDWPLIIALTASADENVWEKCLQVGMNGVIRKPVLLQALADEIRSVLQRAAQGDLLL
jgi:ethylene receptor